MAVMVCGKNDAGTSQGSAPNQETTPPTVPGAVTAIQGGSTSINLSWLASTDNATSQANLRYEICQSTAAGGCNIFTASYTTAAGATNYAVTALNSLTTYYLRVRAKDSAGNVSSASGEVNATTATAGTVNTPTYSPTAGSYNTTQGVTITSTTVGSTLCYTTNGTTPACDATPICSAGTTYASAVSVASTLTLKAIACKSGYTPSAVASGVFTIETTPPGDASSFTATPGNGQATLTWTNPGDADFAGVKILRKTGSYPANQTDGTVVHNAAGTTATSTGLTNGTQYYFKAFAFDAAGNYASGVQATTTPDGTPPGNVTAYSATPGDTQISLSWINPVAADFAGVKILRKTGSYPTNATDGTVVHNGAGTSATDTGLTNCTAYYYKAFAYDTAMNYATGAQITSTPTATAACWTLRTMPSVREWMSVAYGAGLFVMTGNYGGGSNIIATSPDGITWTQRTLPSSQYMWRVVFGGGQFVAVNRNPSTAAATSPDGITWTARTIPLGNWDSLAYGSSKFVAMAAGTNSAVTSPDGITWTSRTLPSTRDWRSLVFGGSTFVAVSSGPSTVSATSPDGITWTQRTISSSRDWWGVAYGAGIFVAVAPGNMVATSTDGITWTDRSLPVSHSWYKIDYCGGLFIISGGTSMSFTNIVLTSTDGINWNQRSLPGGQIWGPAAYGASVFVLGGSSGSYTDQIATSP